MFAWDDIAVFLALYRERTTGRAAAVLGISQPTVTRRLATLEQALKLSLFDRTAVGLVPTASADELYEAAERIERSVCDFTTKVDGLTRSELKVIRLTLLDHFEQLMVPILRSFRASWPGIHAELLPSDRIYDLARGEADIAIRGRERPPGDELVARELPPCGWAVYASADNCPQERPDGPEQLSDFPLALLDGAPGKLPVYQWLEGRAGAGAIRCSNFRALGSTIASGAAISALPCTMGDSNPHLVRCFPPAEEFDVPIFLVARRAVLRRPPARHLFDAIHLYFAERPSLLTGRRG